jgi:hypothetical protein
MVLRRLAKPVQLLGADAPCSDLHAGALDQWINWVEVV